MYDDVSATIVKRQVAYVPGLYKIFDEIIVNAADNKQRDDNMSKLKVCSLAYRRHICIMYLQNSLLSERHDTRHSNNFFPPVYSYALFV